MGFQSTVNFDNAYGLVGELVVDGPIRAEPGILRSVDAANNVFGRVFSEAAAAPGIWRAGNTDGAGVRFAILFNPKEFVSYGTASAGPLAPTITLANETTAAFLTMGEVWAASLNAAAVGNEVIFATATGIISTQAPAATPGAGLARLATAVVGRNPGAAGGVFPLRITT